MTTNTCVWFEIPVTDLGRARTFYGKVLARDLSRTDEGANPIVALTGIMEPTALGFSRTCNSSLARRAARSILGNPRC